MIHALMGLNRQRTSFSSPPIRRGGEGEIRLCQDDPSLVGKFPFILSPDHESKLHALMQQLVPDEPAFDFARPTARLCQPTTDRCVSVLRCHIFKTYRSSTKSFGNCTGTRSVAEGLQLAKNFTAAIGALHPAAICVGDINESNFAVGQNHKIVLLDTDSYQVWVGNQILRNNAGRPEYTPPEHQGLRFATVNRSPFSDCFSVGMIVFALLMRGHHPFAAGFRGAGNSLSIHERIKRGIFPHITGPSRDYYPKSSVPPLALLPGELQHLFRQCIESGHRDPTSRPSAEQWHDALGRTTASDLVAIEKYQPPSQTSSTARIFSLPRFPRIRLRRRTLFATTAAFGCLASGFYLNAHWPLSRVVTTNDFQTSSIGGEVPKLWQKLRDQKQPVKTTFFHP